MGHCIASAATPCADKQSERKGSRTVYSADADGVKPAVSATALTSCAGSEVLRSAAPASWCRCSPSSKEESSTTALNSAPGTGSVIERHSHCSPILYRPVSSACALSCIVAYLSKR
jgi:hypothetical protein